MRWMLLAFAVLTACQMTAGSDPAATGLSAIPGDEISVTSLDAPPAGALQATDPAAPSAPTAASETDPHPKPRPETVADTATPAADEAEAVPAEAVVPPVEAAPAEPKSPQQILCEKGGGQWAVAGETGANICVSPTRDGGKLCTKKGDCQGMCLARSGTCAPFTPLFGCNDVLEKDGRRVTLCIN